MDEGIECIERAFQKCPGPHGPDNELIELLKNVYLLKHHIYKLKEKLWQKDLPHPTLIYLWQIGSTTHFQIAQLNH